MARMGLGDGHGRESQGRSLCKGALPGFEKDYFGKMKMIRVCRTGL